MVSVGADGDRFGGFFDLTLFACGQYPASIIIARDARQLAQRRRR
jgi:hypothetical protein